MTQLYLEDFEKGQRFVSEALTVEPDAIKAFAAAFDPQPFHLDETEAKTSLFGGLVASGWHTAAMTMRLLVESGLPIAGGLIGAGGEIAWPRPTRPGDVLTVECTVMDVARSQSHPERGRIAVRMETLNQDRQAVQVATMTLIAPSRSTTPS